MPNFVFILADDMGYGDVHCLNAESRIPTPHLDQLASQGMTFTDAHSNSAVCTPTRYGVLTGRYCWRSRLKRGVLGGFSPRLIEPGRETVAAFLQRQGYHTAAIGKWHLGLDWATTDGKPAARNGSNVDFTTPFANGPTTLGFEHFFGVSASLDMPPYTFLQDDQVTVQPTEHAPASPFPKYWRAGPLAPGFSFEAALPTLIQHATGYLEERARSDQPFFLYLPLPAPHKPVVPNAQFRGKSPEGPYGDYVMEVDWAVGQVVEALDRLNLDDDTLLFYTSDNGSFMWPLDASQEKGHVEDPTVQGFLHHRSNYHFRGVKTDVWDGGHRVPFFARWPGKVRAGSRCDQPTCLTDFFATCAEVVAQPLPDDCAEDSFSLLPRLLEQPEPTPREAVVHHSAQGMFAVRDRRWKLVLGRGSGGRSGKGKPTDPPGQLYDMQADPTESNNLYEQRPEEVQRLTRLLEKYQAEGRSRPR